MLRKLDLIQSCIILLMLVFIPFKGNYPVLFTIGYWLGTIGIIIGFVGVKLLSRVEKTTENRLRRSILCVNISLLNSVGIQYINSVNNKTFYFVMSIVFLMFAIHFYASIGRWESVQEELNK